MHEKFLASCLLLFVLLHAYLANCWRQKIFISLQYLHQQQRFTAFTTQLRCLVCQNQNIAQSNAELATDLREQIYQQISHGKSDQEIVDYLVARYGNYILYRPPFDGVTLGLWFGPFILLIGGISYLLFYLRKKSREKMK